MQLHVHTYYILIYVQLLFCSRKYHITKMSSKQPKVLKLQEMAIILDLLEKGTSAVALAKQYGVSKLTISKIKKMKKRRFWTVLITHFPVQEKERH